MKKIILIFVFVSFLGASYAYSQHKPFVFGFKAGPTMGWMKPDAEGYESDGVKAGFTWGFIADFFLMENHGITTGFDVVFFNGGIKIPYQLVDGDETTNGILSRKYKLKYIQIPISFKMRTKELGKFRIFGQIGLGSSFLIGAKAEDTFTPDQGESTSESKDIYDDITFMKESLIVGAGVEYSLGGSTMLTAGIVFNNCFMNILKGKNKIDPDVYNDGKANYLALEIGIVF